MTFGDLLSVSDRALRSAWRQHFRIPRQAYWILYFSSLVGLVTQKYVDRDWLLFASVLGTVIALQGIVRWSYYRHRPPALAITLFEHEPSETGRAREVRRIIVTTLRDHVGSPFDEAIQPIDAVVGPTDKGQAHRLRRQLGALYLLFGEIREGTGGDYSVFARLSLDPPDLLEHWDWWTMDRTPQRTIWDALFHKLAPSYGSFDVEYPFEFASELGGIIQSIEGSLWELAGRDDKAEASYRRALALVPNSSSPAVDAIRVKLVGSIRSQGWHQDAIDLLRIRAEESSASPELLRHLAALLGGLSDATNPFVNPPVASSRAEEISLLYRALEHKHDPQLDQTRYNLAQLLHSDTSTKKEAEDLFESLFTSRSHYRRAWYVKRIKGLMHWERAQGLKGQGRHDDARAEFKAAARWDSRTVRARPKVRVYRRPRPLLRWYGNVLWAPRLPWLRRFGMPPILLGAAAEAHDAAGNRIRARYFEFRNRKRRKRLMKLAEEGLSEKDWLKAYANFDWVASGDADINYCMAMVGKAIAQQQLDRADLATESLAYARAMQPHGDHVAQVALAYFSRHDLPSGLPG